ncbi:MAG: hypothetical protein GY850_45985, partial [bacterium]|nr:hypothetical protein [bacterium]
EWTIDGNVYGGVSTCQDNLPGSLFSSTWNKDLEQEHTFDYRALPGTVPTVQNIYLGGGVFLSLDIFPASIGGGIITENWEMNVGSTSSPRLQYINDQGDIGLFPQIGPCVKIGMKIGELPGDSTGTQREARLLDIQEQALERFEIIRDQAPVLEGLKNRAEKRRLLRTLLKELKPDCDCEATDQDLRFLKLMMNIMNR